MLSKVYGILPNHSYQRNDSKSIQNIDFTPVSNSDLFFGSKGNEVTKAADKKVDTRWLSTVFQSPRKRK